MLRRPRIRLGVQVRAEELVEGGRVGVSRFCAPGKRLTTVRARINANLSRFFTPPHHPPI